MALGAIHDDAQDHAFMTQAKSLDRPYAMPPDLDVSGAEKGEVDGTTCICHVKGEKERWDSIKHDFLRLSGRIYKTRSIKWLFFGGGGGR